MEVFKVSCLDGMYLISIVFFLNFMVHFIFFPLICAYTNGQIKDAQDNENYFLQSETKTSIIFQQLGLVQDSVTSYFFKVSRGS